MDYNTIYDDDMMMEHIPNEQGSQVPSLGDDGYSDISFMGRVDDLYDPHINQANNDFNQHMQDFLDAQTKDQAQWAIDRMKEDTNSADYWERCRRDAQIETEKNNAFLDGINAKLDIINKYRK